MKPWRLSMAIIILSFAAAKQKALMGTYRRKELWSSNSTARNKHTAGTIRRPTQQSDRSGKLLRRVACLLWKVSPDNNDGTSHGQAPVLLNRTDGTFSDMGILAVSDFLRLDLWRFSRSAGCAQTSTPAGAKSAPSEDPGPPPQACGSEEEAFIFRTAVG